MRHLGYAHADSKSAALKSVSVRLRPRAPCEIRSGQGQPTAATESNGIQSDRIYGPIPPLSILWLSACRCQDGLLVHARGRPYPQWSRRRGLLVRNELISEAEAPTHPLHIVPPPMTRAGTLMQVASGA